MNSAKRWDDVWLSCYREGRGLLLAKGYEQVSMCMFRTADTDGDGGQVYCCQEDGMVGLGCGARSYILPGEHLEWPVQSGIHHLFGMAPDSLIPPPDDPPRPAADTKGTTGGKRRREWKRAFLRALRETANVSAACRAAGIGRRRAYTCYHQQPAFRAAWDRAIDAATDVLEAEARRRAVDGVAVPVFHAGQQVGVVTRYSDALLVRLLQAYRPDRFADRRKVEHAGGDVPVEVRHTGCVQHAYTLTPEDVAAARALAEGVAAGGGC